MMLQTLEKLAGTLPGKIGIYAACPGTGECWMRNPDAPLMAASVIKLTIMVEAFRQKEAGLADFAQPVIIRKEDKLPSCGALTYLHDGVTVSLGDLVTLMIILSDNTATNLLIDLLGMENINSTIAAHGWANTHLNRKLFQPELAKQGIENYVSARDMGSLLEGLLAGRIISREASRDMLGILRNQRLNGKLPFYLRSRGIACAHKTGEDDGITHDVGIIFTDKPWVLCFLSNETDVPRAERAMQDMAALLAGLA